MHAIPLQIPRTFYVNSTLPPGHPDLPPVFGPPVKRVLPGGAAPHFIYQVGGRLGGMRRGSCFFPTAFTISCHPAATHMRANGL
jgi:hypothetical protein